VTAGDPCIDLDMIVPPAWKPAHGLDLQLRALAVQPPDLPAPINTPLTNAAPGRPAASSAVPARRPRQQLGNGGAKPGHRAAHQLVPVTGDASISANARAQSMRVRTLAVCSTVAVPSAAVYRSRNACCTISPSRSPDETCRSYVAEGVGCGVVARGVQAVARQRSLADRTGVLWSRHGSPSVGIENDV
jgi:hypothetical protein